MLLVVLCPGTPEGSTGSGSGFKASQKTVPPLKVPFRQTGRRRERTCDPWFTKNRFIPYTTAASDKIFAKPTQAQLPNTYFVIDIFQKIS